MLFDLHGKIANDHEFANTGARHFYAIGDVINGHAIVEPIRKVHTSIKVRELAAFIVLKHAKPGSLTLSEVLVYRR